MEAEVRDYRPGDEKAVQAMYERIFERRRPDAEWRWRYREAPAGPAYIQVLELDGSLVGHIAHAPMPTWVDGRRLVLGQGGDTMVLPESRGRGGMRLLVETFLSSPHGFDLRMNFPSEMARERFVRYGAGNVLGQLRLWVCRRQLSRPLSAVAQPVARGALAGFHALTAWPAPRVRVEPMPDPGHEVDELAEASAAFARCIRIRDAAYLRWRWLEQPEAYWDLRAARDRDGRLVGVSVLGLDSGDRGLSGSIADVLARDSAALRALLVDATATLGSRGARSISCFYLDPRPWARRVLVRSGFLPAHIESHQFICRSLTPAAGDAPERLESWYLTRGDTEPWPNTPPPTA